MNNQEIFDEAVKTAEVMSYFSQEMQAKCPHIDPNVIQRFIYNKIMEYTKNEINLIYNEIFKQ